MRFMKKTKIELEKVRKTRISQELKINMRLFPFQKYDESENLEMLTDNITREGKECAYILERSWEFIENLKGPRFNYGMTQKPKPEEKTEKDTQQEPEKDEKDPSPPRKKFKKNR